MRLTVGRREPGVRAAGATLACALLTVLTATPRLALAVPSFASQTGLPCAQCHVIAFGPALTEYGRQFKLNGYTFQRQDGGLQLPVAATVLTGYTHNAKASPEPPPFADNDNLALQAASVFLAGRLGDHLGAFVKGTYDGVARRKNWDNLDVRYARTLELGGHSLVAGLDVNNNPTIQDLWNTSAVYYGFPYTGSSLAHFPSAGPVLRGPLGQTTLGASAYSMIDNRVYLEFGLYHGISDKWLANLGLPGSSPHVTGVAPYARATLQQQRGSNYFAVGAVALNVKEQPFSTTTATDRLTDYGLDATWQLATGGPRALDAHVAWIHEDRHLAASFATGNSDAVSSGLDSLFADMSYVINQTWVGSVGLFTINGTTDHALYGSASGSPSSRGYILQVECVPFGKAGSFASPWINARLGVQYTGYLRFNGSSSNYDGAGRSARDNDALFVFAWLAF